MGTDDVGGIPPFKPTPIARIGERIRRARLKSNLTQSELAGGAFSVSYVSAVERGQIRPSLPALERLAAHLSIPVADLLSEEDEEGPEAPPDRGAGRAPQHAPQREQDAVQRAEALITLGQELEAHGQRNDADTSLEQAVLLLAGAGASPDLAEAYAHLSVVYEQRGDAAHALAYLKRAWDLAGRRRG